MEFINETHIAKCQPKLDEDNYCYYVDSNNWHLMLATIKNYYSNILGIPEENATHLIENLQSLAFTGPIFIFFESWRVAFDELNNYQNIQDTYAVEYDYKVIKVSELIAVD